MSQGFQSFQSGCGVCNASKDYVDMYYSQNPNMSQAGAGKKRRTTKKSTTKKSTTKKSTTKKSTTKKSTTKKSTTKKSTTKVRKMKKMRGGSKDQKFELDEQFIKDNLGISFETVSGGAATPLPSEWYNRSKFMDGSILPGYDIMENKLSPIVGGKKKVKKSTSGKKVKRTSKKKTTSKKH
jgi:hypothetical protein